MKIWLSLLLSAILVALIVITTTSLLNGLEHLSNKSGNDFSGFAAGFIALLTAFSVGLVILWSRYFKQRRAMR